MSKKIKTDDGNVEFEVCHLGVNVTDHHEQEAIWARLSDAQRVELAAALDPGRRGLHVRLDNQAKTLATFQRERDKALDQSKKWEHKAGQRDELLIQAEAERDAAVARAEKAERDRDEADRRTAAAEADRDRWKLHHDRVDGQWAKAEREVTSLAMGIEGAERERDEWKARAEAAEQEASTWRTSTESAHSDFLQAAHDRDEARTRLREVCSTWASAGAAPAPAVDRDAVEATLADGLHRGLTIDQLARSVCAAINGEPAPDPVEELAGEIDGAVRDAVRKGFDFIDSVTGIEVDQKVVDAMLTWLPSESRALARRAFGQEADR